MVMTHAIRIHEHGGPEVLRWEEVAVGAPGPGEVRLRHKAVGLNFVDVYHRIGLYPADASLPVVLGMEGAGVVEAVGSGVKEFRPGDLVAYASFPLGAYAEERLMPAERLVPVPKGIDAEQAAAMMLKGMTAQYLIHDCFPVASGHTVLLHAAAGGVGQIAAQWASHKGATVIGVVGTEEKAALARNAGCSHTIIAPSGDFVVEVKEITKGRGVDVVYDSVGKTTFMNGLDCLRKRGMMVSFGQSSGGIGAFDPALLAAKGSLFLTRPSLFDYTVGKEELRVRAAALFAAVEAKSVKINIGARFPLREAAAAHRALESRQTTGSVVLVP